MISISILLVGLTGPVLKELELLVRLSSNFKHYSNFEAEVNFFVCFFGWFWFGWFGLFLAGFVLVGFVLVLFVLVGFVLVGLFWLDIRQEMELITVRTVKESDATWTHNKDDKKQPKMT